MSSDALDPAKEEVLLFWFNLYGNSLQLPNVESITKLWENHIPSLVAYLSLEAAHRHNERQSAATPLEAYSNAILCLREQETYIRAIDVNQAASGDVVQIAKILLLILNQVRCNHAAIMISSLEFMNKEGKDGPLNDMFTALDKTTDEDWTSIVCTARATISTDEKIFAHPQPKARSSNESLHKSLLTPVKKSSRDESFSSSPIDMTTFVTPRGPNKRRETFGGPSSVMAAFVPSSVQRQGDSPIADVINSPRMQEMRRAHEVRRRLELDDMRDQVATRQEQLQDANRLIEVLKIEKSELKERLNESEANLRRELARADALDASLNVAEDRNIQQQKEYNELKSRTQKYKLDVERLESVLSNANIDKENHAEKLKDKERIIRDIRDELRMKEIANDELTASLNVLSKQLAEQREHIENMEKEYVETKKSMKDHYETELSAMTENYNSEMTSKYEAQGELRRLKEETEENEERLNKKIAALNSKLTEQSDVIQKQRAALEEEYKTKKTLREENERIEADSADWRKRELELESKLLEREESFRLLEVANKRNVEEAKETNSKLDRLQNENWDQKAELEKKAERIDELEYDLQSAKESLKEMEQRVSVEELEAQQKIVQDLIAENERLKSEVEEGISREHTMQLDVDELRNTIDSIRAQLVETNLTFNTKTEEYTKETDELKASLSNMTKKWSEEKARMEEKIEESSIIVARQEKSIEQLKISLKVAEEDSEAQVRLRERITNNLQEEVKIATKEKSDVMVQLADAERRYTAMFSKCLEAESAIDACNVRIEQFEKEKAEKMESIRSVHEMEIQNVIKERDTLEEQLETMKKEMEELMQEKEIDKENDATLLQAPDVQQNKGAMNSHRRIDQDFDETHSKSLIDDEWCPNLDDDDDDEPFEMEYKLLDGTSVMQETFLKPKTRIEMENESERRLRMTQDMLRSNAGKDTSMNTSYLNKTVNQYEPKLTDHERIQELKSRNDRVPPALKSSYFTETNQYSSPSGSEHNIKNTMSKGSRAKAVRSSITNLFSSKNTSRSALKPSNSSNQ